MVAYYIILAVWRLRQEDCKLEDSLGYMVRLNLNKPRARVMEL